MLFLLFRLAEDRYALDVAQVAEVLPLVQLKKIPGAPQGVAGIFDYRGSPVPVIDLCEMMLGRPSLARLSTRLVVVRYRDQAANVHLLGLLAEHATETIRRDATDFVASGVSEERAPYLGPVATDSRGLVQWIRVDDLLTESVRDVLFRESEVPS